MNQKTLKNAVKRRVRKAKSFQINTERGKKKCKEMERRRESEKEKKKRGKEMEKKMYWRNGVRSMTMRR